MKHYSADLHDNSEVITDGRLLIAESRTKGTALADFPNLADSVDGFVIGSTNADFILDAQGSEFNPNTGTKAAAGPINIVRSAALEGTVLQLAFDSDFVHGTDVISTEGGFAIDLASLAGGGAGAATNQTNHFAPVKTQHGSLNTFIDSPLFITGTGYTNVQTLTSAYTTGTSVTLTSTSGLDAFADGDSVFISHAGDSNVNNGNAFEVAGTISGTPIATSANITIASTNADLAALVAEGAGVNDQFSLTRDQAPTGLRVGAGTSDGNLVVSGNLTVSGTTTTINTATVVAEDKYLAVNAQTTDAGALTGTTADGGILVAKATETAAQASGAVAAGTGAEYAGIRFNEGTDGSGAWEVTQGVAANGGADTSWVQLATATNAALKYAGNHDLAASATTITIPAGTVGTPVANTSHGLAGSDFSIDVYDTATTGTYTLVIPEEIQVGNNSAGSGSTLEGTITITFPVLSTTAATTFRVVVKS